MSSTHTIVVTVDGPAVAPLLIPVGPPGGRGVPGTTDHSALDNLEADDHPQYLTAARGDARYPSQAALAAETTTRQSADATEAAARLAGDATLATRATAIETAATALTTALASETTARQTADATEAAARLAHEARTDNPHGVTKTQVGLGNADNTADADKPISTAMAAALAGKAAAATTLAGYGIGDAYTKTETDGRIQAVVGAAPAALDTLAEIAAQLVDDENAAAALATALASETTARQAADATEATAREAHETRSDNPHAVTKAQVGLGNANNTADADKPISTAQAAALALKQVASATLDALSALVTTAFGRSLLTLATAASLRTAIALPTATTVGRLARYTDTAGAQGETAGIYEDATGKIGLGLTDPSEQLTLTGKIRHRGAAGVVYATPAGGYATTLDLCAGNTTYGGNGASIRLQSTDPAADGCILFNINKGGLGAAERMRITSDGYVGIGIVPGHRLHLAGDANTTIQVIGTNSANLNLSGTNFGQIQNGGGPFFITNGAATGDIIFRTQTTERARLDYLGNFGFGTAAPTAKIDNAGDTYRQRTKRTPASMNAVGNYGDHCWDDNYFYICIATNTWHRCPHLPW